MGFLSSTAGFGASGIEAHIQLSPHDRQHIVLKIWCLVTKFVNINKHFMLVLYYDNALEHFSCKSSPPTLILVNIAKKIRKKPILWTTNIYRRNVDNIIIVLPSKILSNISSFRRIHYHIFCIVSSEHLFECTSLLLNLTPITLRCLFYNIILSTFLMTARADSVRYCRGYNNKIIITLSVGPTDHFKTR